MSVQQIETPTTESIANLVRSGGNPYILLTVLPEGVVDLVTAGFDPEDVVTGLREAADQLADHLIEQSVRV